MSGTPSPQLQQALLTIGEALRRNDVVQAMAMADAAVSQGLEEVSLLTLAGHHRMRHENPEAALPILFRARELAPQSVEALNGVGLCLAQLGMFRDAVAIYDDALLVAPGTAYLHLHKAQSLEEMGSFGAAQAALQQAIEIEPGNAQAYARLAGLAIRRGDLAAARDFANRTLAIAPLPSATIALAAADIEDKQFAGAQALVAPLLTDDKVSPINRSIAQGLMGDALDGLDRPAQAFAAYEAGREILRTTFAPNFAGRETALTRTRRIAGYFQSAPLKFWQASNNTAAASPVETHVFLVGFPRSGTTLLEQVLAGHPDIQTLEESDCLRDTIAEFVDKPMGLARFAATNHIGLDRCREVYWKRVEEHGGKPARKVFVDKQPLNTINLGLIARLFPQAKILFALRDPRDVVLSCFRRRLVMTSHMYEFTRLDSAANFYAAVMELAQIYRGTLGLALLDTRHEDMIADFDSEAGKVCAFLGLDFDPAMRDFATLARRRDIKTPSSTQVVRGLSKDGAGQWQRYAEQMAPVLPVLAPWARRFGYKES